MPPILMSAIESYVNRMLIEKHLKISWKQNPTTTTMHLKLTVRVARRVFESVFLESF